MDDERDQAREADSADDERKRTAATDRVRTTYRESDTERLLVFESTEGQAVLAQNRDGYAMLKVRDGIDGDELERYYGFDIALDHVGELLGVPAHDLPVPDAGADMGM